MSVRKIVYLAIICLSLAACLSLTVRVIWLTPATFHGHTTCLSVVRLSPDGMTLASISEDDTIKLWDVSGRKERATLRGSDVTFSSDSKTVACIEGSTIKLWDMASGQQLVTFRGHTANICSIAFSPNGRMLASGSADTTVKLWDVATAEERATYRGHSSFVETVSFSPDGKIIVSGSYGPKTPIRLWDVITGREQATFPNTNWSVNPLVFSPDGKTLASGGNSVQLWNVAGPANMRALDTPGDGVDSVAFSPDGKKLVAASSSYPEVYVWDAVSGKLTARWEKSCRRPRPRLFRYIWDSFPSVFEEHAFVPRSMHFTPSGRLVVLGFDNRDNKTVELWQFAAVPSEKK